MSDYEPESWKIDTTRNSVSVTLGGDRRLEAFIWLHKEGYFDRLFKDEDPKMVQIFLHNIKMQMSLDPSDATFTFPEEERNLAMRFKLTFGGQCPG